MTSMHKLPLLLLSTTILAVIVRITITITITITTISSIYIDEYLFKMKAKDEDYGNVMLILHQLIGKQLQLIYLHSFTCTSITRAMLRVSEGSKLDIYITTSTSTFSTSTFSTSKLLSSSSSSTNDDDDKWLLAVRSSKIYNNGNNSNGALWMSWSPFYLGGLKS